jgi:copper chaperone CopZ
MSDLELKILPDMKKPNAQKGNSFLISGIFSAMGASICCVGPLVLLALGVGGAWIGSLTALEPYRPIFIGLTLLFLGFAFYRREAKVDFAKKTASISFDSDKTSPDALTKATADAGYPSVVHK